jgi:hypothetical protein
MKTYEDEAFDEIEKAQQRKVAHGVTDGNKKDAALRLAIDVLESQLVWFSRDTMIGKSMREKAQNAITAGKEALGDV